MEERIGKLACSLLKMNEAIENANEDLTNALFYTNELSGKIQATQAAVETNNRLFESQLAYLEDQQSAADDETLKAATAAPPAAVAPAADTAELKYGMMDLNRTLNAWVARSVLAYESQGRASLMASAERRELVERIYEMEGEFDFIISNVTGLGEEVLAVATNLEALSGKFDEVNEKLAQAPVKAVAVEQAPTVAPTDDLPATSAAVSMTVAATTEEVTTAGGAAMVPAVVIAPAASVNQTSALAVVSDKIADIEAAVTKNLLLINSARMSIGKIDEQFTSEGTRARS